MFARRMMVLYVIIVTLAIISGCGTKDEIINSPAAPFVELYFDKTAWTNRIHASGGSDNDILLLPTTAANIALSTEYPVTPMSNAGMGPVLTFDSSATGYHFSFHIACLQTDAGFTYDDLEGADLHPVTPADYRDRSISIGDTDDREFDEFEIVVTNSNENYKVYALGIEIIDNVAEYGEFIYVQCADTAQNTGFTQSPDCPGTGMFVGIVSNQDLKRFMFYEDPSGDDIFVRDFYFACKRK